MRQEQTGRTRRQNFEDYYRSHPEKLGGRSINEAYAAMQRQSTRNSQANAETGHGLNPALAGRQAAIRRRLGATTVKTPTPEPGLSPVPPKYKNRNRNNQ